MTVHDYKLICPNYKLFNKTHICEKCFVHKYYQPFFQTCIKNSRLAGMVNGVEMSFHKIKKYYEKGVDVFISPSEFVKNKLVEWKQDKNKIKVIPHFIKLQDFIPNYSNENYIVFIGRLSEEKGVDVLINALKLVMPHIKLKIIGDGPMRQKLESQAKGLNIEFLGYKDKEELKNIVQKAKFLVIPSIWYEVFGLSLLETFALGKPAIGSNLGAIPELIKENETGLLFDPGNEKDLALKIDSLYNNDSWVIEMGQKAREMVEKDYNEKKHYERIMEVYEEISNCQNPKKQIKSQVPNPKSH